MIFDVHKLLIKFADVCFKIALHFIRIIITYNIIITYFVWDKAAHNTDHIQWLHFYGFLLCYRDTFTETVEISSTNVFFSMFERLPLNVDYEENTGCAFCIPNTELRHTSLLMTNQYSNLEAL